MNENIVDRGRTNVIGNEGLDTSQNPINIFEWNDPDISSTPLIQCKSPYKFSNVYVNKNIINNEDVQRYLTISTDEPTSGDGDDNDLWFVREA